MTIRAYVAELLGTFLFFSIGFGAVQSTGVLDAPLSVVVPLAFGLGLLTAIYAFATVSGGHFNPAVTIAMALDRRMAWTDVPGYVVAQLVGAVAAALLIMALFEGGAVADVITRPGSGFSDLAAFGLEALLAAGFVLVILASTVKSPALAGIVIPLTLVAIHFPAIPFTGASVNPARSVGPAVVAGDFGALWIYLVAPLVGAVVGWVLWRYLVATADED